MLLQELPVADLLDALQEELSDRNEVVDPDEDPRNGVVHAQEELDACDGPEDCLSEDELYLLLGEEYRRSEAELEGFPRIYRE